MYRGSWRERASEGARKDASWTEDREKRWWNDEGENEREERAKVGARVYKLVIWGTGHVRGSRSLRRRNKSATYDPSSFPFVSAATSSYHFSFSFSFTFFFSLLDLRARPRLFIRELPSLIISPSLFCSAVTAMALTMEQIFQWFNGASVKIQTVHTGLSSFISVKKRLPSDISISAGRIFSENERSSFCYSQMLLRYPVQSLSLSVHLVDPSARNYRDGVSTWWDFKCLFRIASKLRSGSVGNCVFSAWIKLIEYGLEI